MSTISKPTKDADKFTAVAVIAQRAAAATAVVEEPKEAKKTKRASRKPVVEEPKKKQGKIPYVKPACTHIFSKDGSVCGKPPMKRMPISERQRHLGVPCDSEGFTGSDAKCERHVIFEQYWPWCDYCHASKVAFDAKGATAGYCFACIGANYHLGTVEPAAFVDPILDDVDDVTTNSTWAVKTRVKPAKAPKAEVKLTDEDFPDILSPVKAIKFQVHMTDAVREKNRIMEEKRLAFAASEADFMKSVADEELRISAEHSEILAQRDLANKAALEAAFAKGFNSRQTEILLTFMAQQRFVSAV